MTLTCIVHYKNCGPYLKVKSLSETNKKNVIDAKKLRESLGGRNLHEEQCSSVPDIFIDGKMESTWSHAIKSE